MEVLFEPVKVGAVQFANRVVMAPMTRCRADEHHVPRDIVRTYYEQRAEAGAIVTEATMVSEGHSAFGAREPGIYSDAQVAAWKTVTEAVHSKGGRIYVQLWHGGRACHSSLGSKKTVAPSAIAIEGEIHTAVGKVPHEVPLELSDAEIPHVIADFGKAAKNAVAAGFDGVEIHGANGYLIDQFLRSGSNKRTSGPYSGASLETRARFLLEVVDAVVREVGADRTGVRISPLNSYNSMRDEDPVALTAYVAGELSKRGIAFLHVMRADFFGVQKGDVVSVARANFKGTLIVNMGYTAAEAAEGVKANLYDLVAIGHHYVSNPNYIEKVRSGAALVEPNQATYYTNDAAGYIDYA